MLVELTAIASLGAWLYLFAGRGNFWQISIPPKAAQPPSAKSVCVIIPARNEESVVGEAIQSLRPWPVILVDDHSSDRTATVAAEAGAEVIQAGPLPPGWSGKLWAISEGLKHARSFAPDYFLFTDADIVHSPDNVAELIARAETNGLDVVSLMVKLRCRSFAETLLIPAFVFFFFMLYPPAWVNRRDRRTAAAAGGCILIRPSALDRIGGIAAIHGAIIDDCALARAVKRTGAHTPGAANSRPELPNVRGADTPGAATSRLESPNVPGADTPGAANSRPELPNVRGAHTPGSPEQMYAATSPLESPNVPGAIWLGVTNDTVSIRDYNTFAEIRAMISRTAFAQLHHSALLLAGAILGMAIVYIAPPLLLFTGNPLAAICGLAAWALMSIAYSPTLRFYGRSILWAPLLPLIALFYVSATLDSALSYWTGRGGVWKDRVQDAK